VDLVGPQGVVQRRRQLGDQLAGGAGIPRRLGDAMQRDGGDLTTRM
jgi:hypothetical protein